MFNAREHRVLVLAYGLVGEVELAERYDEQVVGMVLHNGNDEHNMVDDRPPQEAQHTQDMVRNSPKRR